MRSTAQRAVPCHLPSSDRWVFVGIAVLNRRNTMKSILSSLVALSVLAGVAASSAQAATFGSLEYWVEHDRNMN